VHFTAPSFLWLFLPLVLAVHTCVVQRSIRAANTALVLASLIFYTWGSGGLVALFGVSVALDYVAARVAFQGRTSNHQRKVRLAIALSVVGNVSLLGWFKYAGWFSRIAADTAEALNVGTVGLVEVALPIGISFFTFQSMSYTMDVASGRIRPFRNPLELLLYISLFPQLIAGPIVRVSDINDQLSARSVNAEDLSAGFSRFSWGLSKKVLVADSVAPLVDVAFVGTPTTLSAWVGAIAFAVQIYFDFSGYSDMAIGLGRMLGFDFPENFRRPYAAHSVTDFWRRWHITLSSWFRDYVYIPLGGNRHGARRTYRNLLLVFLLTGIWHGAAWTFVLWGMWHGGALLAERAGGANPNSTGIAKRVWVAFVILGGWIVFRAPDIETAWSMLRAMIVPTGGLPTLVRDSITPLTAVALIGGMVAASLPTRFAPRKHLLASSPKGQATRTVVIGVALPLVAMQVVAGTFSPFLYFRF